MEKTKIQSVWTFKKLKTIDFFVHISQIFRSNNVYFFYFLS